MSNFCASCERLARELDKVKQQLEKEMQHKPYCYNLEAFIIDPSGICNYHCCDHDKDDKPFPIGVCADCKWANKA